MAALSCARVAPRLLMKPTCSPMRRLPCTALEVASECRSRAFGRVHKRPSCDGNTLDAAQRAHSARIPASFTRRAYFTFSAAKRPKFVRAHRQRFGALALETLLRLGRGNDRGGACACPGDHRSSKQGGEDDGSHRSASH